MTNIYLVRHAEADGNIHRRIHGHYDGFITPNGYRQIEALRERFSTINIDIVYTSDLIRTRETAKAIYQDKNIPLIARSDLREIYFAKWEDLPWGELLVSYPAEYDLWMNHPSEFSMEGAETHQTVFIRMKKALDEIVSQNPNKTVAVVSHGAAIRTLLCGILYQGDMSRLNDVGWCDNTAVTLLTVDDTLRYNVQFYNSNEHLKALSTLNKQQWWRSGDDPDLYNLHFVNAQFPRDIEKAKNYYYHAWLEIFRLPDYDEKSSVSHMKRLLSAHPRAITYGYRKDDEVGTIMLDTRARLCPGGGHIALLYLNEPYRSLGFGAQFLGHAVSVYRALGRKYITVRVASTNEHAHAFYEKHGFEEFSREQMGSIMQILMRKPIYKKA